MARLQNMENGMTLSLLAHVNYSCRNVRPWSKWLVSWFDFKSTASCCGTANSREVTRSKKRCIKSHQPPTYCHYNYPKERFTANLCSIMEMKECL